MSECGSRSASSSEPHATSTSTARRTSSGALVVAPDERDHVESHGTRRGYVHTAAETRPDDDDAHTQPTTFVRDDLTRRAWRRRRAATVR